MSNESTAHMEVVSGASAALVGLGIVTVSLFPLALPILILTVAATIPLLVPVAAIGLILAVLALPILLVQRLRRHVPGSRRAERRRSRPTAGPTPRVERFHPGPAPATRPH
jgi:hypothetical protein